jgi:hypothetical protein
MLGRILGGRTRFSVSVGLAALGLLALLASGCGGGGGDETPPPAPTPPSAPTVTATPGNGQATLAWAAVSGATSYNVYTSPTSPVTTAGTKTNLTATGTTLPALANGTPIFVAVTAVNAAGESALSSEACAVPTAASTAGLTLYDPLCASQLDGAKWQMPLFSRGVANGAMALSTQASNMEAYSSRGLVYRTGTSVNASGQRVTTLEAHITVPAATAFRTEGAEIRATVRLSYQPPATRFNFPAGSLDELTIQVGLQDTGSGLRAFRRVNHCDNPSCSSSDSSGIAFADSPGFSGEAPASYDTSYLVSVTLNETTGVFLWTITGPNLNVSGTANPAAYLASNANWTALGPTPLAGTGFQNAGVRTRLLDNAGGSSARMSARFDDVRVGFNNAPPTLWDDFSGGGGNSGPTELSAAKWTNTPGMNSLALTAGSLVGHAQATTPSMNQLAVFHPLEFINPASINTIQADFTVSSCNNSLSSNSLSSTNRVGFAAGFYNDGTPGTTGPDANQPNSRVGDVTASLFLDCPFDVVRFQVTRFDTNGSQTVLSNSANAIVPKGPASIIGNTHTLRMQWNPTTRLLTFQADGQTPVVVDPTTVNTHMLTAAPYVKPANTPGGNLSWFLFLSGGFPAGATANVDFRANNVFTAP